MSMCPASTRYAPQPSATAAPIPIPVSVMPRDSVLVAMTHIVLLNSACALVRSISARSRVCPNALIVASPWMASRNSAPNAPYVSCRAALFLPSRPCQTAGATSVTSAAIRSTRAIGMSTNATEAKISTGVSPATKSCGRY